MTASILVPHRQPARSAVRRPAAFTLVELLVVIGIIGLLVGLVFSVTGRVRASADQTQCANNMRQLVTALAAYANEFGGAFPPNSAKYKTFWYQDSVIGRYAGGVGSAAQSPSGGVLRCSMDLEDAARSYSMNLFATSHVSDAVRKKLESDRPPGKLFRANTGNGSALILLVESWSELPLRGTTPTLHSAQAIVGLVGKPGQRFGGGIGVGWTDPPGATPNRFPSRPSQIAFNRHRAKGTADAIESPRGKANFAFADAHVELIDQAELVDQASGRSSLRALWSVNDREVDAAE